MKKEIEKDEYREVAREFAEYVIILPSDYETSAMFYASEEDMLWALENSWFDQRDAIPAKLLKTRVVVRDEVE